MSEQGRGELADGVVTLARYTERGGPTFRVAFLLFSIASHYSFTSIHSMLSLLTTIIAAKQSELSVCQVTVASQ